MSSGRGVAHRDPAAIAARPEARDPALGELVDRLLDRGVVVKGDLVVSLAGVDLLYIGLDLVLSSVETLRRRIEEPETGEGR